MSTPLCHELEALLETLERAAETGYIPADKESKDQMVGFIKLTGGGQSGTLTFTAGEPGEYPFFCSSPGHFDKMHGKIVVKAK